MFIAHGSGGYKSKTKVLADSGSIDTPLPGSQTAVLPLRPPRFTVRRQGESSGALIPSVGTPPSTSANLMTSRLQIWSH